MCTQCSDDIESREVRLPRPSSMTSAHGSAIGINVRKTRWAFDLENIGCNFHLETDRLHQVYLPSIRMKAYHSVHADRYGHLLSCPSLPRPNTFNWLLLIVVLALLMLIMMINLTVKDLPSIWNRITYSTTCTDRLYTIDASVKSKFDLWKMLNPNHLILYIFLLLLSHTP